jgi:hypothetical protein
MGVEKVEDPETGVPAEGVLVEAGEAEEAEEEAADA